MIIGRMLMITGVVLIAAGAAVMLMERGGLFRLPGDIVIERRNFTLYFPIMTSVILSIVLTAIFWLIGRGR